MDGDTIRLQDIPYFFAHGTLQFSRYYCGVILGTEACAETALVLHLICMYVQGTMLTAFQSDVDPG